MMRHMMNNEVGYLRPSAPYVRNGSYGGGMQRPVLGLQGSMQGGVQPGHQQSVGGGQMLGGGSSLMQRIDQMIENLVAQVVERVMTMVLARLQQTLGGSMTSTLGTLGSVPTMGSDPTMGMAMPAQMTQTNIDARAPDSESSGLSGIFDTILEWGKPVWNAAKDAFDGAKNWLGGIVEKGWSWVTS